MKWSLFSILTLLFNGGCSVIQKIHQIYFPLLYQKEFMMWAMITVCIILLLISFFSKKESESNFFTADGIISGVMNGVANYIVLYLAAFENATVLFPIVSVINIVAVCLLGSLIFKEKLTTRGIIGILIGITAVIMLKLN